MTTDVFSHPWLGDLFGAADITKYLSADAQLTQMRHVESAYARALGRAGVVPVEIAAKTADAIQSADISIAELKTATARDGVVVPGLVHQIRAATDPDMHLAIHKGLTSQDVIDTALILTLKHIIAVFDQQLHTLQTRLQTLLDSHGSAPLMGRTRMQAALPIMVQDRVKTWLDPLQTHRTRLAQLRPRLLQLQFGGAAGDRAALGEHAAAVAAAMAETLELENPATAWHTKRDSLAEFSNWLSLVTGTLGKMGQDIALMAQQGVDEIRLLGGGGSSAMPHKQNPVLAELLVTLGRYNATQLSGMHQALIHEQERSGAAWALEWMILPNMLLATGRSLTAASELCEKITQIGHSRKV